MTTSRERERRRRPVLSPTDHAAMTVNSNRFPGCVTGMEAPPPTNQDPLIILIEGTNIRQNAIDETSHRINALPHWHITLTNQQSGC